MGFKKLFLLQNRYIPVLFILALFVIFRFYFMNKLIEDSKHDTYVINLSGKQRMHTQKTLAMAQMYFLDKSASNKEIYITELDRAYADREKLIKLLQERERHGSEFYLHENIKELANKYRNLHLSFIKEPTKENLMEIQNVSEIYLNKVEGIVNFYQESSDARHRQIQLVSQSMSIAFLTILALSALFVFYPASKKITEYTELLKTKKLELERYISLVDEQVIVSSTDLDGNITYASDAFCRISKYSKSELFGKNHRIIRHPDMPPNLYDELWDSITQNRSWSGEIRNLAKDGTDYWVKAVISPIFDAQGNKIGYTAIRQDISDKKKIEEISITDGMTGLFNRRYFNDIFPRIINNAKRDAKSIAFLILDIDHFKQYNDTYGHQKGDEALIRVAKTIKDTFKRSGDVCFRLGGEEFGVIFTGNDEATALEMANGLRQNIESLCMEHIKNSASKYVTASMGLVLRANIEDMDMDTLYKDADELLYKAKESGRNRVCLAAG